MWRRRSGSDVRLPVLRGKEAWCAAACIPRHSVWYGDCRKDSLQRRGNALRPLSAGPCGQRRLLLWGTHFVGNGALAVFAGVFFRPVFQCVEEREQGVGDACSQQCTPYGCGEYVYIHSPEITKYRCNNGTQECVEQPRRPAPARQEQEECAQDRARKHPQRCEQVPIKGNAGRKVIVHAHAHPEHRNEEHKETPACRGRA